MSQAIAGHVYLQGYTYARHVNGSVRVQAFFQKAGASLTPSQQHSAL
jgi:hypothetical protein